VLRMIHFIALLCLLPLFLASNPLRNLYAFEHQTKWACFYRTSSAIEGLNPAIWRLDQYKNLIMAGLNYNCAGCLCYTFDHRFPVSEVSHLNSVSDDLVTAMTSIDNCQVLSYRVNLLKGSSEDVEFSSIRRQFGCDDRTMKFFFAKDFRALRELEKLLLTQERREEIEAHYKKYVEGPHFFNPETVQRDRRTYFQKLFAFADGIAKKVVLILGANV
jgi:hypothetical protein